MPRLKALRFRKKKKGLRGLLLFIPLLATRMGPVTGLSGAVTPHFFQPDKVCEKVLSSFTVSNKNRAKISSLLCFLL